MTWVLIVGSVWVLLAVLTAVVVGRAVRIADERRPRPFENSRVAVRVGARNRSAPDGPTPGRRPGPRRS
jgi:hypothetical protein